MRLTALGTGAVAIAGPAPTLLLGGSVFAELGWSRTAGAALRLAVTRATTGIQARASGHVRFVLNAARVEGCPFALGTGEASVTACLVVVAGALHAEGVAVAQPESVTRSWVDVGPLIRTVWLTSEPIHLELAAGFGVPLTRRAFVFTHPETVVQEPSALAGRVGIFLAGALP